MSEELETKSQERFVIVRDDNGNYGCRDTERKETAWCTTRETAYRILFDSVAGKAHEWSWWNDNEPEPKSEQIRREAAEALEKVEAKKGEHKPQLVTMPSGVTYHQDTTAIDKLIEEYEAHAAMNEKISAEYRDRAEMQRAMVKRAKELKGGA